jgi:hypothetical protein
VVPIQVLHLMRVRIIAARNTACRRAAQKPLRDIQVRQADSIQGRRRVIEHLPVALHELAAERRHSGQILHPPIHAANGYVDARRARGARRTRRPLPPHRHRVD